MHLADRLLDVMRTRVACARATVFAAAGAHGGRTVVPLALQGADCLPFADPSIDVALLGRVWRGGRAEAGRTPGPDGVRSVMAVPLLTGRQDRWGMVVLDRTGHHRFRGSDLRAASALAGAAGSEVLAALDRATLRESAAQEERERLARHLHDGLAQELVVLGYRIDSVRRLAASGRTGAPAPGDLPIDGVRRDLTSFMADLRMRIADLRATVRPGRTLGASLAERLGHFETVTGLAVGFACAESSLALPSYVETSVLRLLVSVLADARTATGASAVRVRLEVNAPRAALEITHDGVSGLTEAATRAGLRATGASVQVERTGAAGVIVRWTTPSTASPAASGSAAGRPAATPVVLA